MNTKPEKKLPAHLQPWPEHWLPKAEYLAHIAEPRHYWKIVPFFAAVADRNQVTAALGRLVKTGEATRTEKNFYQATGHTAPEPGEAPSTWDAAQIAAACESLDIDPIPLLATLRGDPVPIKEHEDADDIPAGCVMSTVAAMRLLDTTDPDHPDIDRLMTGKLTADDLTKRQPAPASAAEDADADLTDIL